MSRRKQSNPKPLKWDECWNEKEDGGESKGDNGHSNAEEGEDRSPRSPSLEKVGSTEEVKAAAKSSECRSPSNPEEFDDAEEDGTEEVYEEARQSERKDRLVKPRFRRVSSHSRSPLSSTKLKLELNDCTEVGQNDNKNVNKIKSSTSGILQDAEKDTSMEWKNDLSISDKKCKKRNRSVTPESVVGDPNDFSSLSQQQLLQAASLRYLRLFPPPPLRLNDPGAGRLFLMSQYPSHEVSHSTQESSRTSTPCEASMNSTSSCSGTAKTEKSSAREGGFYMCEPCGIKFSSARTLEAHQTHYCSYRRDSRKDVKIIVEDLEVEERRGSRKRSREETSLSENSHEILDASIGSDSQDPADMKRQNGCHLDKAMKSGKMYSCIHCSYSADKKVSLNRHMRMHTALPTTQSLMRSPTPSGINEESCSKLGKSLSTAPGSVTDGISGTAALDRFCQDCEIQFSSIKTYRVHKQYYCSTRHVLKAQQFGGLPSSTPGTISHPIVPSKSNHVGEGAGGGRKTPEGSPIPYVSTSTLSSGSNGSNANSSASPRSSPLLVLATNPVIVVPYSFIQTATFLPPNVSPPGNALLVLHNGTVQNCQSFMHPQSSSSANINLSSNSASPSNSNVFNDPKEIINTISSLRQKPSLSSESIIVNENLSCSRTASPDGSAKLVLKEEFRPLKKQEVARSRSTSTSSGYNEFSQIKKEPLEEETERMGLIEEGIMPAIDLTLQSKREVSVSGDDEKENREQVGGTNNDRQHHPYSGTTTDEPQDVLTRSSPCLSVASASSSGKRPSSTSVSSVCSTPPAHAEAKTNGSSSHKAVKDIRVESHGSDKSGRRSRSSMPVFETDIKNLENLHPGVSIPNAVNNSVSSRSSSLSPISTQLPGGAILTTASGQPNLAELLLSNPPELNESLAKLNPQLFMSSSNQGLPLGGGNPVIAQALSSEIALRLLDPSCMTVFQAAQQIQQQQQQQHAHHKQSASASLMTSGKRGVSKCVECDIVFYKYENYLVHKEHYCAARVNGSGGSLVSKRESSANIVGKTHISPEAKTRRTLSPSDSRSNGVIQKPHRNISLKQSCEPVESRGATEMHNDLTNEKVFLNPPILHSLEEDEKDGTASLSPNNNNGGNSQTSLYICSYCSVKFSCKDNWIVHQNLYCSGKSKSSKAYRADNGLSPHSSGLDGLISCGHCKLAIPEDQMKSHTRICLNRTGIELNPSIPNPKGSVIESNCASNARAFICIVCGYKGNTQRGIKTHVRTHFDKRLPELIESDYYTCITGTQDAIGQKNVKIGQSMTLQQGTNTLRKANAATSPSSAMDRESEFVDADLKASKKKMPPSQQQLIGI